MYRLYRRLLLLVLVALGVAPSPATAQISVTLAWDHPAPSTVTGFTVSVDGAAARDYGSTPFGTGRALRLLGAPEPGRRNAHLRRHRLQQLPDRPPSAQLTAHGATANDTVRSWFAGLAKPGHRCDRCVDVHQPHLECDRRQRLRRQARDQQSARRPWSRRT